MTPSRTEVLDGVRVVSARFEQLPDVIADEEAAALAELLANSGCPLASSAVLAGQRDKKAILRDAVIDATTRMARLR